MNAHKHRRVRLHREGRAIHQRNIFIRFPRHNHFISGVLQSLFQLQGNCQINGLFLSAAAVGAGVGTAVAGVHHHAAQQIAVFIQTRRRDNLRQSLLRRLLLIHIIGIYHRRRNINNPPGLVIIYRGGKIFHHKAHRHHCAGHALVSHQGHANIVRHLHRPPIHQGGAAANRQHNGFASLSNRHRVGGLLPGHAGLHLFADYAHRHQRAAGNRHAGHVAGQILPTQGQIHRHHVGATVVLAGRVPKHHLQTVRQSRKVPVQARLWFRLIRRLQLPIIILFIIRRFILFII